MEEKAVILVYTETSGLQEFWKHLDAACEECDEKNATDNDFFLHIMEALWSGGLKNVFV